MRQEEQYIEQIAYLEEELKTSEEKKKGKSQGKGKNDDKGHGKGRSERSPPAPSPEDPAKDTEKDAATRSLSRTEATEKLNKEAAEK